VIEFGAIEIAIGKCTLNKSNSNKITSGKITIVKLTRFKFFEVHILFTISGVLVDGVKKIGGHRIVLVPVGAKLLISVGKSQTHRKHCVFYGYELERIFNIFV
jgi:hypothetical protein